MRYLQITGARPEARAGSLRQSLILQIAQPILLNGLIYKCVRILTKPGNIRAFVVDKIKKRVTLNQSLVIDKVIVVLIL